MNTQIFNSIVETAKEKAANDPRWLRAIEKAAAGLADGSICVTLFADDTAQVTTPNGIYRVNGSCPCAARTAHCYHRAAKRIWALYEEAACKAALPTTFRSDVATSPRQNLIAEIENIWPRVEPTVHLADALVARFGRNRLDMLNTETLRDIRLAIAL